MPIAFRVHPMEYEVVSDYGFDLMARWQILTATAVVVAPLLAGCGPDYIESPPATPVQLEVPACVGNWAPPPSRIPEGFVPVEAIVCGEKIVGSPREKSGRPYLYTRYRGDFTAVVADFARRDREQDNTCDASTMRLPEVWLINSGGLGLIPRFPMDECGTRNIKALNTLIELPVVEQRRVG